MPAPLLGNKLRWLGAVVLGCLAAHGCAPEFDELTAVRGDGRAGVGGGERDAAGAEAGVSGTTGGEANHAGDDGGGRSGHAGASGGGGRADGTAGTPSSGNAGKGGRPSTAGAGAGGALAGMGGAPGVAAELEATPWPVCDGAGTALKCGRGVLARVPRNIQDDFTIEAWIATSVSRTGTFFYQGNPVAWADKRGDALDFGISVLNGKLVMSIGLPETAVTSTSVVATGEWVHIAGTRQRASGTFQLYVNGELEATGVGNKFSLAAEPMLSLGGATVLEDVFLEGRLDEVKLWATVRTKAEIQAGMHEPPHEDEPGLVGYYRFDELVGITFRDHSLVRNHGTISGAAPLVRSDAPLCEASAGSGGIGGATGEGGAGAESGATAEGGASAQSAPP